MRPGARPPPPPGSPGGRGPQVVIVCLFGLLSRPEELEALRKETRLLLGLCLDSRARYRASTLHLDQARQDYQEALNICRQEQGDAHPQVDVLGAGRRSASHAHCRFSWKTLVLMSDLATVLDLQGHHGDALALVQQAVELSRSAGHPDQHVLLGNLAGVLLHTGGFRSSPVWSRSQPPPCVLQDASMIRSGSTRRLWVWLSSPETRRLWTRSWRGWQR